MNCDSTAAERLKSRLVEISPLIEEYTAAVCPGCRDVCCKQRHGIMNDQDRRYAAALAEPAVAYDPEQLRLVNGQLHCRGLPQAIKTGNKPGTKASLAKGAKGIIKSRVKTKGNKSFCALGVVAKKWVLP